MTITQSHHRLCALTQRSSLSARRSWRRRLAPNRRQDSKSLLLRSGDHGGGISWQIPLLVRFFFVLCSLFFLLAAEESHTALAGTFPIKIRFEGPNVVEGLRELAAAGVLETPVPAYVTLTRYPPYTYNCIHSSIPLCRYLANVHSLARNSFVVQDMNRVTDGDAADTEEKSEAALHHHHQDESA